MRTAAPAGWLAVDRSAGDLEGQIHRAVRERVLAGALAPGSRLPSSRALAGALGVARSTVVGAYDRLRAEGFLEAATGSSTRVAAALPALPALPVPPRPPLQAAPVAAAVARHRVAVPPPPPAGGAFRPGIPDLGAFPHAIWARCLAARARSLRVHDLGYGSPAGIPELRRAILAHVSAARGVAAGEDQVVVVPSTSAALDLVARLLLRPGERGGDVAWMEEPGYPTAQAVLRGAGARLVPVPCDAEGMDVARAPRGGGAPRLVYVTPSHQCPTGVAMGLARRMALLGAAAACGAVVLEDDYDSEFQHGSRPIASLQGIDRHGSVAYLGTFSKVLAPGLRVAYAVLPPWLVADAADAVRLRGAAVPVHVQAALADFIAEGHLRAHVRRMGAAYAARMAAMAEALRRRCGHLLEVGCGGGGLQLLARFRDPGADDDAAARALGEAGIAVQPLSGSCIGPPQAGLLFGIACVEAERAAVAAEQIAAVLAPVGAPRDS